MFASLVGLCLSTSSLRPTPVLRWSTVWEEIIWSFVSLTGEEAPREDLIIVIRWEVNAANQVVHASDLGGVPTTSVWTERGDISQQLLEHLGTPPPQPWLCCTGDPQSTRHSRRKWMDWGIGEHWLWGCTRCFCRVWTGRKGARLKNSLAGMPEISPVVLIRQELWQKPHIYICMPWIEEGICFTNRSKGDVLCLNALRHKLSSDTDIRALGHSGIFVIDTVHVTLQDHIQPVDYF